MITGIHVQIRAHMMDIGWMERVTEGGNIVSSKLSKVSIVCMEKLRESWLGWCSTLHKSRNASEECYLIFTFWIFDFTWQCLFPGFGTAVGILCQGLLHIIWSFWIFLRCQTRCNLSRARAISQKVQTIVYVRNILFCWHIGATYPPGEAGQPAAQRYAKPAAQIAAQIAAQLAAQLAARGAACADARSHRCLISTKRVGGSR